MNGFFLLVWLAMAQMPSVQVATLTGEQHQGTLEAFSANSIIVKTDTQSVSIPIGEVLLIRSMQQPAALANEAPIEVRLVDNSRLRVKSFNSSGTTATVVHPQLGELRFPLATVSSVRLAPSDAKVDAEWMQMIERTIKKDAVAVRKGDVLDHLDGVIGSLNDATMQFQMDGDDIAIKRDKLFGLIYSKRESSAKKAIAQLDLVPGDRFAVKQIGWNGTVWKVRLVSGLELEVSPQLFQSLDYSFGKVTYLSDLEPRTVEHTPFHDIKGISPVLVYRRDMNFDGSRISLGDKTYTKGLAIHSQTQLKYRLGGEYRRFQAIMGIGNEVPNGDVDVVMKGDGKILFKAEVKSHESGDKGATQRAMPQPLDIDVTGIVEFEIFVGYGSDKRDIGDRLYLANARAVK